MFKFCINLCSKQNINIRSNFFGNRKTIKKATKLKRENPHETEAFCEFIYFPNNGYV